MGKFIVSAGIGLAAGLICFFISVAFLAILLLGIRGASGVHPDMTLAYRVAAPVALLAAMTGFTVALVRSFRASRATR
ncbi:MAG: hypothetical protein LAP21_19765 [Acidobacteriia bacterium]|nr:hypothetical protein [Terriglobia bacterium]